MDLFKTGLKGIKWITFSRILKQLIQFVTLVILANILEPTAFGLMGLSFVVLGFMDTFRDFGLGSAIIQKTRINDELFSTIFFSNFLLSIIFTTTLFFLSPILANFLTSSSNDVETLSSILKVLGLIFIFNGISSIHLAKMEKDLLFEKIAIAEVFSATAGALVGIIMAFLDYGVWSLVFQSLIMQLTLSIYILFISRQKTKFHFAIKDLKLVSKFSSNLTGFNFLNYIVRNLDYLLIGKYLGATELGYYSLAYRIMIYPISNITNIVARVMYPIYSRIKEDHDKFREIFKKVSFGIAFITFPLMAGLIALSEEFVYLFLGPKWENIIFLIILLAPIGAFQSIAASTGSIYQATGKTDLMLKWGLFSGVIFVLSFIFGLKWGIIGIASSYGTANLLIAYLWLKIPFKLISLKIFDFFKELKSLLVITFLMLFSVISASYFLSSTFNDTIKFVIIIIFGGTIYLGLNYIINKNKIQNALNLIFSKN